MTVALQLGSDAMYDLEKYGLDFLGGLRTHGDNFIYTYKKNGDAVIQSGCVIIKEESNQIFYVNKAGTTVRIPKQSQKVIDELIKKELNDPNLDEGKQVEVKVAAYIRDELEVDLTEFQLKIDAGKNSGNNLGEIDCATKDFLIEVKKSAGDIGKFQIKRYLDNTEEKYFNVYAKKVILYIDEPIEKSPLAARQKLDEIGEMKDIKIVNGLEELKGVFEKWD